MAQIQFFILLKALALWIVCAAAADFPIPGIDISCAPEIDPGQCVAMALDANPLAPRAVSCDKVTGILSAVKALGPQATAFCSSYLRIPSATTLQTTITPPAVTNTITETEVSTVTVVTPIGFKRWVAGDRGSHAPVHAHEARAVPAALRKFAARELSSASSCLSIKPTSTRTVTVTAPTPPLSTVVVTTNVITTITTCTTNGGPCNCNNPGACCGAACSCNDGNGNPVSTCFGA